MNRLLLVVLAGCSGATMDFNSPEVESCQGRQLVLEELETKGRCQTVVGTELRRSPDIVLEVEPGEVRLSDTTIRFRLKNVGTRPQAVLLDREGLRLVAGNVRGARYRQPVLITLDGSGGQITFLVNCGEWCWADRLPEAATRTLARPRKTRALRVTGAMAKQLTTPLVFAKLERRETRDGYVSQPLIVEDLANPDGSRQGTAIFESHRISGSYVVPMDVMTRADLKKRDRTSAAVYFRMCVSKTGHVTSVEPQRGGPASYANHVKRVAKTWRFEPYQPSGEPVAICAHTTTIAFSW